ncbi:MAG: flagellar basal body-associated FliL family protein [Neomegalonema sp.]|nr:flagellar basal body-associated FliL family protein [Neomegalonema sp.]
MSDQVEVEIVEDEEPKKKGGKGPLLIGVVLALLLGGGSFYGVYAGMVPVEPVAEMIGLAPKKAHKEHALPPPVVENKTAYLNLDPMAISLKHQGRHRQLRLKLSIETDEKHLPEVEHAKLRIVDAINTMLRSIDPGELMDPSAMDRLRAQILFRIRLVAETEAVNDLLIEEYVVI